MGETGDSEGQEVKRVHTQETKIHTHGGTLNIAHKEHRRKTRDLVQQAHIPVTTPCRTQRKSEHSFTCVVGYYCCQ